MAVDARIAFLINQCPCEDVNPAAQQEEQTSMIDAHVLAREWVELREESQPDRIVLRPTTYNVPPARGRRRLDLSEVEQAVAKSPGPNDRLQRKSGTWSVEGGELSVNAPGWTGTYRIEELTEDKLVLCPK